MNSQVGTLPEDNHQVITHRWQDIRVWIALFFLIRLIGITNAPLETGHNWRQSLTAMIARNFFEHRANLLYPEIDYAGAGSGIIGSEFPFFNYLIYLVSLVFDYSHWYGRLINLVVSSIGIYFFYKLISKLANSRIAFNASIVLLSSIWFAFSRKIMPDTFSISLVIIGLYYGYKYLMSGGWSRLLLFFILTTLGVLCKIPALSLMAAIGLLIFVKEISLPRKIVLWIAAGVGFGIVSLWYFYWVPYLVETYHNQLYFPRGLIEGLKEIIPLADGFFRNFYFNAFHSYAAFAAFLAGCYFLFRGKYTYLKAGVLIVTIFFLLFILKTGIVFPLHNYYIIPFVPVMALVAGIALEKLPAKYLVLALLIIVAEGIVNQQHDFFVFRNAYKKSLEVITNKSIGPDELIVINGGQSPQEIYFAHRKGWSVTNDQITPASLTQYKNAGASYLIINIRTFPDFGNYLPLVHIGRDYDVFSLKDYIPPVQ